MYVKRFDLFFLLFQKGTGEVEVIILDLPKNYVLDIDWKGKAFKKMKNLIILIIKNVRFSRGPQYLPNSLRVLEWWGYPSPNLPPDFRPNKLSVLDMKQNCLSSLKPIMASVTAIYFICFLVIVYQLSFSAFTFLGTILDFLVLFCRSLRN